MKAVKLFSWDQQSENALERMGDMEGAHCLWRCTVQILFPSVLKGDTFMNQDKNLYYFRKNGVSSLKYVPVGAVSKSFLDSFQSSSAL